MSNVQIWNGSNWMDFYTLPNATSSTLGGVKIGNNITVSNGTISLTQSNVTSALGYTPLSPSGVTMTGNLTLYAASGDSPRLTFQRGTLSDNLNDWSLYDSSGYLHIQQRGSGSTAWETRATFNQSSVNFVGAIQENGTLLSSKYAAASHNHDSSYLGKTATAADSSKLGGQLPSYYATATSVSSVSEDIEGLRRELDDGSLIVRGAYGDGNGNTITDTYATKTEATTASKQTSSASSTSKLFLIGATSQSANASTTYSNSKCYVGTDNCLYSNNTKVLTSHAYRPIQMNGSSILTSGSSTALNLKAGTNISLSNSNGTVTISSTASGGGMTCAQVFEGAGDTSGQYHQAGSWGTKINIVSQGYKLLVFNINIADYEFPFCAYVPSSSFSYTIKCACANQNGNLTVIEIVYSDSSFTATQVSGGPLYNVNIYAYK